MRRLSATEWRELRHEVGNSLAAAASHAQTLLRRAPDWADAQDRASLAAIHDSVAVAGYLLRLPSVAVERCDLSLLTRMALAQGAPERLQDVRLRVHPRARLVGDWRPEPVTRVVANLLSNAAKYSLPGTPIEVELTRVGGLAELLVNDRGIGIEPEDLEAVFHGWRTPRARQMAPGSGSGLRLSRRLVAAEGGRLWATSVPGQGSTFHLTLPLASAGQPKPGAGDPYAEPFDPAGLPEPQPAGSMGHRVTGRPGDA